MHSEICPVCHGSGKVNGSNTSMTKPCHGCKGKGWIGVNDVSHYRKQWRPVINTPRNPFPF